MKVNLSDYRDIIIHAEDKITGLQGIITGHADYITGCDQYLLQPKSKDNEFKEARWIDEYRLKITSVEAPGGLQPEDLKGEDNGSDIQAPVK